MSTSPAPQNLPPSTGRPFRETLDAHLGAIQARDLDGFAPTVAEGDILVVTSDGRLVRSSHEFLQMHRDWFASGGWSLNATPLDAREVGDLAHATLRLDYRGVASDGRPIHEESVLTLIFERRGGRWVMTVDQNTPIRPH